MITVHGSGRSHGRAVGNAGAVVAEGDEGGAAARLASAAADRRHTVPGPDRCSVAGRARRVRAVRPGLRPVPKVAAGRHLAPHPRPVPGPDRRERRDHAGPERRFHGVPRPSACGRGPQAGRPAEGTTGRCLHRARRSRTGTLARRVHDQAAPGCRARSEAHVDRGHGRAARRLAAVRARAGEGPRASHRAGPATRPPQPGPRGQGVSLPQEPCLPAPPRNPLHHPRQG